MDKIRECGEKRRDFPDELVAGAKWLGAEEQKLLFSQIRIYALARVAELLLGAKDTGLISTKRFLILKKRGQ